VDDVLMRFASFFFFLNGLEAIDSWKIRAASPSSDVVR
jgi:hypothetical protein